MKKLIAIILLMSILSIVHVSAQSGSWKSYSGSSGSTQTILSETSDKALKIEIQRIQGDFFSVDLQITSDKETYTESFLSESEEFVIKASSIIMIFDDDVSGQYRITFYDSYADALLSATGSSFAFGTLFGGTIFLIVMMFFGYLSWRRD